MNWTKEEELRAKKEYLSMIDTLKSSEEFKNVWTGVWDDFQTESFGKKKSTIKGDKHKYMKYWLEDQKIINDPNWDKIQIDDYEDGDF